LDFGAVILVENISFTFLELARGHKHNVVLQIEYAYQYVLPKEYQKSSLLQSQFGTNLDDPVLLLPRLEENDLKMRSRSVETFHCKVAVSKAFQNSGILLTFLLRGRKITHIRFSCSSLVVFAAFSMEKKAASQPRRVPTLRRCERKKDTNHEMNCIESSFWILVVVDSEVVEVSRGETGSMHW
jgi:hypothetical protein